MKTTIVPYLRLSMQHFNSITEKPMRKTFFRLYPIALLSCSLGLGWCFVKEKEAEDAHPQPTTPAPIVEKSEPKLITLEWRGNARESREKKPQFVW